MEEPKEKKTLTDEEVEQEIERLRKSPAVKLAKKAEAIKYRRRQYMYTLRMYEKRGMEMAASGMTMEKLADMEAE